MNPALCCSVALSLWAGGSGIAAVPDTWNIRTSPVSNTLNGVAYGNGLYVAVGSAATILTSPEGVNWTRQSAGTTAPTFWCAAFGAGRYVAGGGEGGLLRSATDGLHWTNGLATTGAENLNGVAYGNGLFVAVGRGPQLNTSYILTSRNGLDWAQQVSPTTNTLLAVSPDFDVNGVGWAEDLLVAVGERGTILTSVDGTNWVLRNSGTTVTLRSVVFQGGFLVGGDYGVVLRSSNAMDWVPVAPTSFHVRGLASSGYPVVVGVGNYASAGRLHVSTDGGNTWPGYSLEFPQVLNAITYGAGSFVAVGENGLIVQSSNTLPGGTNNWTRAASGSWEEPFWSLGRLPAADQALVAFRNAGWKALAIGANTTANYPGSLSLSNLLVEAPADSANQLLLNYAGLAVPLTVSSDFMLGANASLVSYYSALRGGSFLLSSPAAFSEFSTVGFNHIELQANSGAQLNLTNSSLWAGRLALGPATSQNQSGGLVQVSNLVQSAGTLYDLAGGTLLVTNLDLQWRGTPGLGQFIMDGGAMTVSGALRLGSPLFTSPEARGEFLLRDGSFQCAEMDFQDGAFTQTGGTNLTQRMAVPLLDNSRGAYFLSGGTLVSSNVALGAVLNPTFPASSGVFMHSAGVHSNLHLQLYGLIRKQTVTHFGSYSLFSGLLVSDSMLVLGGAFSLQNGTNYVRELMVDEAGSYRMADGWLVTSNTTVDTCCCVLSDFTQHGGSHTVQNRLLLQDYVRYSLLGGSLSALNIELRPSADFFVQGGSLSNPGLFTIRGGALRAGGQNLSLGRLQVIGETPSICVSTQPLGPVLDLGGSGTGPTVLRFQDSREVAWSGAPLAIVNWSPTSEGYGPDQLFVGTNAQALTAAQLSQVTFSNPFGWNPGSYPARLLSTGELVPAVPPNLTFRTATNALVLSWSGDSQLAAATNIAGPWGVLSGATSPQTVPFTGAQRFFRLRLPGP